MEKGQKFKAFYNVAGFLELYFCGEQTPKSVMSATAEMTKWSEKLNAEKRPVLILMNVSDVHKIDISGKMSAARKEAVKAMTTTKYDRMAVYGNVAMQILINTLVLIAGKRDKARVFTNRVDAVKWLKAGNKNGRNIQ